jgi:hypothetical protein
MSCNRLGKAFSRCGWNAQRTIGTRPISQEEVPSHPPCSSPRNSCRAFLVLLKFPRASKAAFARPRLTTPRSLNWNQQRHKENARTHHQSEALDRAPSLFRARAIRRSRARRLGRAQPLDFFPRPAPPSLSAFAGRRTLHRSFPRFWPRRSLLVGVNRLPGFFRIAALLHPSNRHQCRSGATAGFSFHFHLCQQHGPPENVG